MQTSIEISMYPLHTEYEQPIIHFIKTLKENTSIKVITNSMSTQAFGSLDDIMSAIKEAMQLSWVANGKSSFVVKFLPGDLSPQDGKYLLEFD